MGRPRPQVPLAKPARNTIHPKSQEEMDADPLTYSENARVRVAREFFTAPTVQTQTQTRDSEHINTHELVRRDFLARTPCPRRSAAGLGSR